MVDIGDSGNIVHTKLNTFTVDAHAYSERVFKQQHVSPRLDHGFWKTSSSITKLGFICGKIVSSLISTDIGR